MLVPKRYSDNPGLSTVQQIEFDRSAILLASQSLLWDRILKVYLDQICNILNTYDRVSKSATLDNVTLTNGQRMLFILISRELVGLPNYELILKTRTACGLVDEIIAAGQTTIIH